MLFNVLGVTSSQYVDTLKGNGQRYELDVKTHLYNKVQVDLSNVTLLDFENVILDTKKVILGAEFNTENKSYTRSFGKGKGGQKLTYNPFYVGYQTYHDICYTRKSNYTGNLKRTYDLISLDSSLLHFGNNLNVEMRIIVHHPGQLIRNLDKPCFTSTLGSYIKSKVLEIKLSSFTKLSKRPDSNIRCNPDLENDDLKFLQEVIKYLDCIPVYWSYLLGRLDKFRISNKRFTLCKTFEKLRMAADSIDDFRQVLQRYEPPCEEMVALPIITREIDQSEQRFLVKVTYAVSFYQEIKNVKEFTLETFWSTAGGYLGIFLGYSLLQVPELLKISAAYFQNMNLSILIGKFLVNRLNVPTDLNQPNIFIMYTSDNLLYFILGLVVTKGSERVFALFGRNKIGSNSMNSLEGINHSRDDELQDVVVQMDAESKEIEENS